MKSVRAVLGGALLAAAALSAALPRAGAASETLAGELRYTPAPEVSICFCGSYLLASESGTKDVYLVSEAIDLMPFAGRRVTVRGRSYTGLCDGTLALYCDFFAVEKIAVAASADADGSTWGAIKSLYP